MHFECKYCAFKLPSIRSYLSHYQLHRNVKNLIFPCCHPKCNKVFVRFNSLKSHMTRYHLWKEMPSPSQSQFDISSSKNICSIPECNKIFWDQKELVLHVKHHITGRGPVPCPFENCSKAFTVKSSFTAHISRKHLLYPNSMCVKSSDQNESDLTLHNEGHMNIEDEINSENDISLGTVVDMAGFKKSLALFFLKLESVHLVPVSTIDTIRTDFSHLHSLSLDMIKSKLRKCVIESKMCSENAANDLIQSVFEADALGDLMSNGEHNIFGSNYRRMKYMKQNFSYVEPFQINLGLNASNKLCSFSYVSVKKTLQTLLTNKNIADHISDPTSVPLSSVGEFCDILDGEAFKKNSYFKNNPTALKIILYQDAFEIVNPLGSARKKHKILAFYYTLADIYGHNRSTIDSFQLAILCREIDFEYFGNKVIEPLLRDIEELSTNGVEVNGCFRKANVICILGDNLGSHILGGFVSNFGNAYYFCRYCNITKQEFQNDPFSIHSIQLRDLSSYNNALSTLDNSDLLHVMGIKSNCSFHLLEGFHVCNPGLPPCLGHDLFEGVVKYDIALFLKEMISKRKWFQLKDINFEIQSLKFKASESGNRPPLLKADFSLKGHAVQNWTLLRILPFLLRDFISDPEDNLWQAILLLRNITEYLCAYRISINQIAILKNLIDEYIELRKSLFPNVALRPKHHYFNHYPWLITQFGPLLHVWTMRFESKHTFFKRCIRNTKNFINVTKSLSEKHQLLQAYCLAGNLFTPDLLYDNLMDIKIDMLDVNIQYCIKERYFNTSVVHMVDYFTVNGTPIKKGMLLIIDVVNTEFLVFGQVEICLLLDSNPSFVCKICNSYRSELGLYILDFENVAKFRLVLSKELPNPFPLNPFVVIGETKLVALKGYPFDQMIHS